MPFTLLLNTVDAQEPFDNQTYNRGDGVDTVVSVVHGSTLPTGTLKTLCHHTAFPDHPLLPLWWAGDEMVLFLPSNYTYAYTAPKADVFPQHKHGLDKRETSCCLQCRLVYTRYLPTNCSMGGTRRSTLLRQCSPLFSLYMRAKWPRWGVKHDELEVFY